MLAKFARVTQKLAGMLLGGVGVGVQISTVLICLALVIFGSGVIIDYLTSHS